MNAFLVTLALVGLVIAARSYFTKRKIARRRSDLIAKYGSPDEADRIMNQQIWAGMTSDQLIDSVGKPEGIDQAVTVRKTREVWKYHKFGENRYRNRVTVEQGRVTAWTAKGG